MTEPDDPPTTSPDPTRAAVLPGLVVVVVTLVVALAAGSDLWFFSDDWNIIAGWPEGRLLEPFNSHLSLVPIGLYQLLFHTFGLGSYTPYRLVGLASYALLGLMVLRFALDRFGRSRAGALGAALVVAAVLWNEGGSTNVMFPFLLNFSLPVAALLAVWWHLDRDTTRHTVAASAWLVVAVATSGLGLLVVAAVAVELAWTAVAERRPAVRRWAILAPGPGLWLLWYLLHGVDSPSSGGLRPVASYTVRMLLAGARSVTAGNRGLGVVFLVGLAVLALRVVLRGGLDGRLAGAVTAPVAFSVLTAVSRIGVVPAIPPDELRYRWTIAAFLVLLFVLLLRADHDAAGRRADLWRTEPWRPQAVLSFAAVLVLVGGNRLLDGIDEWNDGVDAALPGVRANLWEAEVADAAGVLDRDRALPVSYVRVTAGAYVDAVDRLGSPLDGQPADAFVGDTESVRAAAQAFVDDFDLRLAPGAASCRTPTPVDATTFDALPLAGASYAVTAADEPVTVRLRLSPAGSGAGPGSGAGSADLGVVPAGATRRLDTPDLRGGRGPLVPVVAVTAGADVSSC